MAHSALVRRAVKMRTRLSSRKRGFGVAVGNSAIIIADPANLGQSIIPVYTEPDNISFISVAAYLLYCWNVGLWRQQMLYLAKKVAIVQVLIGSPTSNRVQDDKHQK